MQSVHLLGSRAYELYPAVDCPADAFYLNTVHYVGSQPVRYERSACVFEQSRGSPLRRRRQRRRHHDDDDGSRRQRVDGLTDNVLIVRTVLVFDYYDYVIDVVFHQNAVVEVVCSVSGSLITHYYHSPATELSGYKVRYRRFFSAYLRLYLVYLHIHTKATAT